MSSPMWEARALSILLIPSGEKGAGLLDLARDWTGHGLLAPALWVRPEAVDVSSSPPIVRAVVMAAGPDGALIEEEVDLFEVLAQESLQLVRLIKVRSALPDRELDELQDSIADVVSIYVGYSMPQINPAQSAASDRIELIRASLVCAPTDFQMRERIGSEINDSSVLVVASPEDRANPTAGDAFVRDNERFTGFVLLHLATIAGLWSGLPIGSLEMFDREGSAAQSIWIPRVFVSGVLTDGLASRAAAQVLSEVLRSGGAVSATEAQVTAPGTSIIPSDGAPGYVERMVRTAMTLDDAALSFRQPVADPEPDPRRTGILRLIVLYLRFSWDKFKSIPRAIARSSYNRVARKVDTSLNGEDGYRSIAPLMDQMDARDRQLLQTAQAIADAEARSKDASSLPPQASSRRSSPRLWSGLRTVVFSSLDGSSEPGEGGFDRIEDLIPVFASVHDVVPDPDDVWRHPGPTVPSGFPAVVNWRQLREHPELREVLVAQVTAAQAELDGDQPKLQQAVERRDQAESARSALQDALLDAGLLKYRADGKLVPVRPKKPAAPVAAPSATDQVAASAPEAPAAPGPAELAEFLKLGERLESLENTVKAVEASVARHQALVDDRSALVSSFDQWAVRQRGSFVWQILDRMADGMTAARAELATAEAEPPLAIVPGELLRLRRRFHRGLIAATSSISGLGILSILLPFLGKGLVQLSSIPAILKPIVTWAIGVFLSEHYPAWWQLLLGTVGALVLAVNGLLIAYYRGWSRFERKVQRAEARMYDGAHRVSSLRAEIQRLELMHGQATDWLDDLTTALSKPWKVKAEWLQPRSTDLDRSRLPFALHIAHAVEDSSASSDRLKRAAAQDLVKIGWRADAFAELVDAIRQRLGLSRDQLGVDALDNDLPDASNNARRRLRSLMSDDEILEDVAERRVERMAKALQLGGLYASNTPVEPVELDPLGAFRSGDSAHGAPRKGWMEFLLQTLGTNGDVATPLSPLGIAPHEVQQAHHQTVTSYVLAPERIATDLADLSGSRIQVRPYGGGAVRSFDAVVRVDLVGPVPLSAINLWSDEPRAGRPSRVPAAVAPTVATAPPDASDDTGI